jgi:Protein of unknown function (DUF3822)
MKKSFEILPDSFDPAHCILLCEVSNEGFSYAIKHEDDQSFRGVAIYHFDRVKPTVGFPIALQVLFHDHAILSRKFKKTIINYSFPQSVLIPFSLYNRQQEREVMNLMFGDLDDNDIILTDVITNCNMYNTYRIPAAVYEVVQNQFAEAEHVHQYSVLLRGRVAETNSLDVIFYSQKIVVTVIKDGTVQLVNTYSYETAEDVSYHLLNISQHLELQQLPVKISGLVEENSTLYKEIYKYFTGISLQGYPEGNLYSDEISAYPAHYFSHIFSINTCE